MKDVLDIKLDLESVLQWDIILTNYIFGEFFISLFFCVHWDWVDSTLHRMML